MEIVAHLVYELDLNGKQLRVVKYTDYAAENVRSIARSSAELRGSWADAEKRSGMEESGCARVTHNHEVADSNPAPAPIGLTGCGGASLNGWLGNQGTAGFKSNLKRRASDQFRDAGETVGPMTAGKDWRWTCQIY